MSAEKSPPAFGRAGSEEKRDWQGGRRIEHVKTRQFELCLPARPVDDVLHEQLAAAVERFNAESDPAERVELHREVVRLRGLLGRDGVT